MRLTFHPTDVDGGQGRGLEVHVEGFTGNFDDYPYERSVFVEVYEGKLRVLAWDGTSEDPNLLYEMRPAVEDGPEDEAGSTRMQAETIRGYGR